jgi:[ribosomal protein S5]-alanine N-acetyltransferase
VSGPVVLETPRLTLRVFDELDLGALESVHGDPRVMRFSVHGPKTREQISRFIHNMREGHLRNGFSQWAVVWKATGQCIGECGILLQQLEGVREHEIGYRLNPDFWGRGIATEAASACRDHGFATLGLDRLVSIIDPQNAASIRVAEKVGMIRERSDVFHGIPVSIYGLNAARRPALT